MNRLGFFKKLLGVSIAAPLLAKAAALSIEESAQTLTPKERAFFDPFIEVEPWDRSLQLTFIPAAYPEVMQRYGERILPTWPDGGKGGGYYSTADVDNEESLQKAREELYTIIAKAIHA